MKDKILITVSESGELVADKYVLLMEGENKSKTIVVTIPSRFNGEWIYVEFERVDGKKLTSNRIITTDSTFSYLLVGEIVALQGTLKMQLVVRNESGFVWKSTTGYFNVKGSINATEEVVEQSKDLLFDLQGQLDGKQDKLTAGRNIEIKETENGVVISAVDSAGFITVEEADEIISNKVAPAIANSQTALDNANVSLKKSQDALEQSLLAKEESTIATTTANTAIVNSETANEIARTALEKTTSANENSETAIEISNQANSSANYAVEQSRFAKDTATEAKTKVDLFDNIITQSLSTANNSFEYAKTAKEVSTTVETKFSILETQTKNSVEQIEKSLQEETSNRVSDKKELNAKIDEIEQTYKTDKNALNTAIQTLQNGKQDNLVFDEEYNETINKVATVKTVTNQIAKVVAKAPESLDTLEEIASWIEAHPESVSDLNLRISENAKNIASNKENIQTQSYEINNLKIDKLNVDVYSSFLGSEFSPLSQKVNNNLAEIENFKNGDNTFNGKNEFTGSLTLPNAPSNPETASVTDTYTSRQTANADTTGLTVVDGSMTTIDEINGSTVKSKNLISFPYGDANIKDGITHLGVTYNIDKNGVVTLNGTSTADFWFQLKLNIPMEEDKPYTISGAYGADWRMWRVQIECRTVDGTNLKSFMSTDGASTFTSPTGTAYGNAYIFVAAGQTFNNQVFKPMLNEGENAEPYTPYFSGLRNAEISGIKSIGKNLIPFPYSGKVSESGITFSVNNDGTITLNGKNDGKYNSAFYLIRDNPTILKVGTYYCSIGSIPNVQIILFDGSNYKDIHNRKFTLEKDTTVEGLYLQVVKGNDYAFDNVKVHPMLNMGETELPYEPYTEETYNLPKKLNLGEWDRFNPQTGEIVRGTGYATSETGFTEEEIASYDGAIVSVDGVSLAYKLPTTTIEKLVNTPVGYTVYDKGTETVIGNENEDYGAIPTITQTYSIHDNPKDVATHDYVQNGLAQKLDKTGGTITGHLVVEKGTDTTLPALVVKNNEATYGLALEDDTYKLGKGNVDEDGNFAFDEGEGLPVALRDDSSEFKDGDIVLWQNDGNKFVSGGGLLGIIYNSVYPVGSIYMSDTESNNPNNWENAPSWTWERIENKYLATQGTDFPITDGVHTGGSNSVTLATNNLPSHTHSISHTHGITVQTMANSGYTTSATVAFRETDSKNNMVTSTSGFASKVNDAINTNDRSVGQSIAVDSAGGGFSLSVDHTHNASTSSQSTSTSGSTGSGQAFTVKPAYYVVYAWKRVA